MLKPDFFNRDAILVAKQLLGKVLKVKSGNIWLSAMIIETEAYYKNDKASHASLGYTKKRKALFMPPGTIYMYYSRAGDSLNVSCKGDGNAVLIKSAVPYANNKKSYKKMIFCMKTLNPMKNSKILRPIEKLCAGQALLCKSLGLKISDWDQEQFNIKKFYIKNIRYKPKKIIQTKRLGITKGRDEHLFYRFIDYDNAKYCSSNPLQKKYFSIGKDYFIV